MKLLFSIFIFLVFLSCGQAKTHYQKVSAEVLNGLRRKKQINCLQNRSNNLKTLQDNGGNIFQNLPISTTWEVTYTKTDKKNTDNSPTTHKVTLFLESKNAAQDTLIFIVGNEDNNASDSTYYKKFRYTLNNHRDHIQLLVAESCLVPESSTVNTHTVKFIQDVSTHSTTRTYHLTGDFPAFFSRYMSYISEIRSGDTTTKKGEVNYSIAITGPSVISTSPPSSSPVSGYEFPDIVFDSNNFLPTNTDLNIFNTLGINAQGGGTTPASFP